MKETVLFRGSSHVLSVDIHAATYSLAPVGEKQGPFRISLLKFSLDKDNPTFLGYIPISGDIHSFQEAITFLHVGFECVPPRDPKDHAIFALALAGGLISVFAPERS